MTPDPGPNPHALRADKDAYVQRHVWNNRQFSLGVSKWGFCVTATDANIWKSVIESLWLAVWDAPPMRWLLHRGIGYGLWNRVLAWADGQVVAFLPVTDEQARSFYPSDESFDKDWGWHFDDTDGTVD